MSGRRSLLHSKLGFCYKTQVCGPWLTLRPVVHKLGNCLFWHGEHVMVRGGSGGNNFPAGAGQIVWSNLFLLGHIPFLAGQTSSMSYH